MQQNEIYQMSHKQEKISYKCILIIIQIMHTVLNELRFVIGNEQCQRTG